MKKRFLLRCIIGGSAIALALAAGRGIPLLRAQFLLQPVSPVHIHAVAQDGVPLPASALSASTPAIGPIFASGRRAPLPSPLAASTPEPLPRLSGIMIMGGARQAIFESGDTTQVVVVGDRLGPYRIVDIERASVTVEGPQGVQTLRTDGDGAVQAASPTPTDSSPPSLLDQLHTQPPPVVAVPRPPSLTQMLSRLPKGH